jgi:hypothetical protein
MTTEGVSSGFREPIIPAQFEEEGPLSARPSTKLTPRALLVAGGFFALMLTLGGVALASPSWVLPSDIAGETPEIGEAGLRLAIVRERQRVEAFAQRTGRLPLTLAEAGSAAEGIRYATRRDGTYLLEADVGRSYVRLASNGSVEAFLGNSLQVILSRSAP